MPYGAPWICFHKYCLCLLPCIWERKVQCFLSLSISRFSFGRLYGWKSRWCCVFMVRLLMPPFKTRTPWRTGISLENSKALARAMLWPFVRRHLLAQLLLIWLLLLAIDHIHTLLERGGILLPLATLPCARHCVRAFDAPHQLFLPHRPKLPVNLPFRSDHRTDLLRSSKPFPIRQNGSFQSRLSRW